MPSSLPLSRGLPPFGALLESAWQLFIARAPRLMAIAFVTGTLSLVMLAMMNPAVALDRVRSGSSLAMTEPGGASLSTRELIASLVVGLILDAVTTLLILQTVAQPREPFRRGLGHTTSRFAPYVFTEVLVAVLVALGLALFIVPGVMLLFLAFLAPSVVFLENRSPVSALRRSAELTRGIRMRLFLYAVGVYLLLTLFLLVMSAVPYLGTFVEMVVVVPFLIIIVYRIYLALTATPAVPPAP